MWQAALGGDADALAVLFDKLEDEGFSMLKVGVWYYVRSATWSFVGRVAESGSHGVTLEAGAWRVAFLNDEQQFLETGRFAEGDEASRCPGPEFLPTLWIGPTSILTPQFVAQIPGWQRTHAPSPLQGGGK